jgi:hypothetical protein
MPGHAHTHTHTHIYTNIHFYRYRSDNSSVSGFSGKDEENSILRSIRFVICQAVHMLSHKKCIIPKPELNNIWTKVSCKRGRLTEEETEWEAEHTKESESWLNQTSTSNRYTGVGGIPTINVGIQMVCTFIDTFCNYTTCIMRSLRRSSRCYWSAVDCDGRATCSWSRLTALLLGDCWECACSSLRLARWSVLFSGARWSRRVDPAGSH